MGIEQRISVLEEDLALLKTQNEFLLAIIKSPSPEILSTDEAADFCKISKSTFYKKTAEIKSSPRGKRIYFTLENLCAWLMEKEGLSQAEIDTMASDYIMKKKMEKISKMEIPS